MPGSFVEHRALFAQDGQLENGPRKDDGFDESPVATNEGTLFELTLAAQELSRPERAGAFAGRAREAGSLRVLPDQP
jgi:hypothetical protein